MIPLTFNIRNSVGLLLWGFSGGSEVRVCLEHGRPRFDPWVGKIPWRRKWQPTPEKKTSVLAKTCIIKTICAFAKIQGSSPTPTFISPHSVINSCLHCLQNAPRAWPIPHFTRCSSSNQDTITSALDLNVAFQLISLFSFLPPTSNLAT